MKYILRVEIPFWSCINPEIWQNVYCLWQKHKLSTYQAMLRGNNMPLSSSNIYKPVCTTNPYSQMCNETTNIIERYQFKKQSLYLSCEAIFSQLRVQWLFCKLITFDNACDFITHLTLRVSGTYWRINVQRRWWHTIFLKTLLDNKITCVFCYKQ